MVDDNLSRFDHRFFSPATVFAILVLGCVFGPAAFAQGGSPTPGGYEPSGSSAQASVSAPMPGADFVAPSNYAPPQSQAAISSKYQQLPLSEADARARLQELRTMVQTSRPQDVQQSVNRFSEWLADIIDGHNKLANVFSKHDNMKAQCQTEHQTAVKFAAVRNQAQLLKADLLIREHRYPEALAPLVDIVIAEPTTATGQSAYKKLKELGFCEEAPVISETDVTVPAKETAAADNNAVSVAPAPAKSVIGKTVGVAVAQPKKVVGKTVGAASAPVKKVASKSAHVAAAAGKKVTNSVMPASSVKGKKSSQ
jgi:hypothetical protein